MPPATAADRGRPVRAALFDFGDTLGRVHPSITTHYRRALAAQGIPATVDAVRRALRVAGAHYRRAKGAGRPLESDRLAADAFWREYNDVLLRSLGVSRGRAERAAALADGFYHPTAWRCFPEARPVLRRLRADGVRVGIVSNFTPALLRLCDALGLLELCDVVLASTVVGSEKPDVSIFRLALRQLGADPQLTIHVGDTYTADVLGARAAGITPVLVARADRRPRLSSGDGEPVRAALPGLDCAVVDDLWGVVSIVGNGRVDTRGVPDRGVGPAIRDRRRHHPLLPGPGAPPAAPPAGPGHLV